MLTNTQLSDKLSDKPYSCNLIGYDVILVSAKKNEYA